MRVSICINLYCRPFTMQRDFEGGGISTYGTYNITSKLVKTDVSKKAICQLHNWIKAHNYSGSEKPS